MPALGAKKDMLQEQLQGDITARKHPTTLRN